jgi:hypothetical protein
MQGTFRNYGKIEILKILKIKFKIRTSTMICDSSKKAH